MGKHLHLFSNYESLRLAHFSSPIGGGLPMVEQSPIAPDGGDGPCPLLLDISWIEVFAATQQRMARIGRAATNSEAFSL
jgi:hypothetical protein